jgi:hypothetical protein
MSCTNANRHRGAAAGTAAARRWALETLGSAVQGVETVRFEGRGSVSVTLQKGKIGLHYYDNFATL